MSFNGTNATQQLLLCLKRLRGIALTVLVANILAASLTIVEAPDILGQLKFTQDEETKITTCSSGGKMNTFIQTHHWSVKMKQQI